MPKIYRISAEVKTPTTGEVSKGKLTQVIDSATDMYISVEGFKGIYQNLLKTQSIVPFPVSNSGVKTIKTYKDLVFTGDTFITGNTINEMPLYSGHHTYTTEQNSYNGSSSYGVVNLPSFSVSSATRTFTGLTTGSTGVNFEDGTSFTLPIAFTGNQSSISANTIDFKFKLFKYDSAVSGFSTTPAYSSDEFSYSSHTSSYTITSGITKSSLNTGLFDGEYLVKGFYEYDPAHPISKELKLRHDNYNIITGTSLNIYQPSNDWYMIMLQSVQKPVFNNVGSTTLDDLLGSIKTVRHTVGFNGQTAFTISDSYLGNPIVVVNGITLTSSLDYNITTVGANKQVGFTVTLLTTDVVTITYILDGSVSNVLTNEYQVAGVIVSGHTGDQGTNKVYYNTTESKYEYYLDSIPPSNAFVLLLNGINLTQNIDFYQSSSNKKRIIFNSGSIQTGDIISVFYEQGTGIDSEITTNTPTFTWSVPKETTTTASTFSIQMALYADKTFSDVKFSEIVNHSVGAKDYSTTIGPLTGLTYGDKVLCRIINNKKYTTISGSVLSMTAISETVTTKIATNSINTY